MRTALVVGVVVSILFYERVQLTTGGAIVPAYLAMFLPAPLFVATTVLSGYLTYFVVSVVVAKRKILYGRRKFEVEMLVGLAFVTIGTGTALLLRTDRPLYLGLTGIGFLLPGVIAHDMFRQGPRKTLFALAATTAILGLFVFVFASLLDISPFERSLASLPLAPERTGYPLGLILPAAVVSVLAGMLVFSRLGLRSGGFITGAYIAPVTLRFNQQIFLSQVYQSITIACIAMRMVLHTLPNDVGNFIKTTIIHFLHGMQNAPLYRL